MRLQALRLRVRFLVFQHHRALCTLQLKHHQRLLLLGAPCRSNRAACPRPPAFATYGPALARAQLEDLHRPFRSHHRRITAAAFPRLSVAPALRERFGPSLSRCANLPSRVAAPSCASLAAIATGFLPNASLLLVASTAAATFSVRVCSSCSLLCVHLTCPSSLRTRSSMGNVALRAATMRSRPLGLRVVLSMYSRCLFRQRPQSVNVVGRGYGWWCRFWERCTAGGHD